MTDDKKRQADLDAAQKKRQEELDALIAAFVLALGQILEQWQAEIIPLLSLELGSIGAIHLLTFFEAHIAAKLRQTDYAQLMRETILDYRDSIQAVTEIMEAANLPVRGLTWLEQSDLEAFGQIDLARLTRAAEDAVAEISEAIVTGTITQQPVEEITAAIAKHVEALKNTANQIVDTGILTSDRYTSWLMFSDAVKKFKFVGPDDERTRPFCRAHVDRTYTREQIGKMDNHNLNPPWLYGGGWNCRHNWQPQV